MVLTLWDEVGLTALSRVILAPCHYPRSLEVIPGEENGEIVSERDRRDGKERRKGGREGGREGRERGLGERRKKKGNDDRD